MWMELTNWLTAIAQNLVASFLAVVFGITFTYLVRRQWDRRRYGGWRVIVLKKGVTEVNREISVEKAKEILHEGSELAVFLKGVASPYGWINCDILQKGVAEKLLVRDDQKRLLWIDLDRNPRLPSSVSNEQLMDVLRQLAQHNGLALSDTSPVPETTKRGGSPTEQAS
jgi:hypothetical protein